MLLFEKVTNARQNHLCYTLSSIYLKGVRLKVGRSAEFYASTPLLQGVSVFSTMPHGGVELTFWHRYYQIACGQRGFAENVVPYLGLHQLLESHVERSG